MFLITENPVQLKQYFEKLWNKYFGSTLLLILILFLTSGNIIENIFLLYFMQTDFVFLLAALVHNNP